tara:strand:- start:2296 stop:3018 length:723 start_codon:yes stop_codon:yes gene_type:complete
MLKFCLTVDCEKFISLKQINPRWNNLDRLKGKINNLIKNLRYNENGFNLIYNEIKNQKFPCTLMLVGKLFRPLEKFEFIEYGYHSFNHIPLTLISNKRIEEEIKNIYNVKSITPPLWMIEDVRNPERVFKILKKHGYKNIVYKGQDKGTGHSHKLSIRKPEKRFGIRCVYLSNCFEGNSSKKHIQEIKKQILNNLDKEVVYLLSTHDFTHKNLKNLKNLIYFIKKLENQRKIKPINLKNV